eukprot:349251-Rhodomonas_salina.1
MRLWSYALAVCPCSDIAASHTLRQYRTSHSTICYHRTSHSCTLPPLPLPPSLALASPRTLHPALPQPLALTPTLLSI